MNKEEGEIMGVEEGRNKKSPHTMCIRHMAKKYTTDTLFWHSSMREITASELKYHLYHFGGPSGGASGQGLPPKARRQLLLYGNISISLLNATKNSNVSSYATAGRSLLAHPRAVRSLSDRFSVQSVPPNSQIL